ncbi:MAG: PocR ligand-binding domain-containing protein [Bacteroidales bacterium]|nr:PocR ligand-binding domain-containing protein [Bacteroidales bacterium]
MKSNLLQFIDFEKVNTLLEGFNKTTGFVTAILDLDGNVLSKSGWKQICTEFHRVHPDTAQKCKTSDTELANKMAKGLNYKHYKCLNGLVNVAVPLIVNGEHIANLFSGQFFFEKPDRAFFKQQAKKYGFDEKKYLEALDKVPVVSENEVKVAMDFLLNMTQLISEMTLQKQEQTELNKALKEKNDLLEKVFDSNIDLIALTDLEGNYTLVGKSHEILGYDSDYLIGKNVMEFVHPEDVAVVRKEFSVFMETGEKRKIDYRYKRIDGTYLWFETYGIILK